MAWSDVPPAVRRRVLDREAAEDARARRLGALRRRMTRRAFLAGGLLFLAVALLGGSWSGPVGPLLFALLGGSVSALTVSRAWSHLRAPVVFGTVAFGATLAFLLSGAQMAFSGFEFFGHLLLVLFGALLARWREHRLSLA